MLGRSDAVLSMLISFLLYPCPVDRVLHLLHQDHRIPPQARRSVPVEVALPGAGEPRRVRGRGWGAAEGEGSG